MSTNDSHPDNGNGQQTKWERQRHEFATSDVEHRAISRQHDIAQTHLSDWSERDV